MGSAILGVVIGLWMYSPRKRYRYDGAPTSIPYRGQKRLHTIFGLIFGVATATWAFSGLLSMDPFPTSRTGRPPGRRGGGAAIGQVLRGPAGDLSAFADKHPRQALAQLSNRPVKELELTTFGGVPIYMATLAGGETRIVPVHGDPRAEFTRQEIIDLVAKGTEASGGAEITLLQQYDSYYVDRRRERPLPVILVRLNDDEHTRYYIDPRTARIAGTYSSRNWVSRWLYHGLHSLDFPWLYNHRPLWDIVVITFMVGGTALSVTSLILAWRVLGRKLNRMIVRRDSRDPPASEDLVLEADG